MYRLTILQLTKEELLEVRSLIQKEIGLRIKWRPDCRTGMHSVAIDGLLEDELQAFESLYKRRTLKTRI